MNTFRERCSGRRDSQRRGLLSRTRRPRPAVRAGRQGGRFPSPLGLRSLAITPPRCVPPFSGPRSSLARAASDADIDSPGSMARRSAVPENVRGGNTPRCCTRGGRTRKAFARDSRPALLSGSPPSSPPARPGSVPRARRGCPASRLEGQDPSSSGPPQTPPASGGGLAPRFIPYALPSPSGFPAGLPQPSPAAFRVRELRELSRFLSGSKNPSPPNTPIFPAKAS